MLVSKVFCVLLACAVVRATVVLQPVPILQQNDEADRVPIQVYGMSKCSDFKAFIEWFGPLRVELGHIASWRVDYIATPDESQPFGYSSSRGEEEIFGDLLELCVEQLNPEEFFDFVICLNKDMSSIPRNFEACAAEAKIDPFKIQTCASEDAGKKMLSESVTKALEAKVTWSPTVFVGGQLFGEFHKDLWEAGAPRLIDAVCKSYKGEKEPYICHQVGRK